MRNRNMSLFINISNTQLPSSGAKSIFAKGLRENIRKLIFCSKNSIDMSPR